MIQYIRSQLAGGDGSVINRYGMRCPYHCPQQVGVSLADVGALRELTKRRRNQEARVETGEVQKMARMSLPDAVGEDNIVSCPVCDALYYKQSSPETIKFSIVQVDKPNTPTCVTCTSCSAPFCVECVVPWHQNLSCHEFRTTYTS